MRTARPGPPGAAAVIAPTRTTGRAEPCRLAAHPGGFTLLEVLVAVYAAGVVHRERAPHLQSVPIQILNPVRTAICLETRQKQVGVLVVVHRYYIRVR